MTDAKPFLKWAGGKRALMPHLLRLMPEDFENYFEPFVGGGALFFELANQGKFNDGASVAENRRAELSDANERLIRSYRGVRDGIEDVIYHLKQRAYTPEEFARIRGLNVDAHFSDIGAAAWMIYLNKCCFNGLYRVNKSGNFNVPFGRYVDPVICDEPRLRACSAALQGVNILRQDFEVTAQHAQAGDFVYFDPPYVPTKATSFVAYEKGGFTMADQARLRDCALELKRRGVHVMLSNSAAPEVFELYREGFDVHVVQGRGNSINSSALGRFKVQEVVIR